MSQEKIPSSDDLHSWFESYPRPSSMTSTTRFLIADNYYFKDNFGAAYYYAESVENFYFFEELKIAEVKGKEKDKENIELEKDPKLSDTVKKVSNQGIREDNKEILINSLTKMIEELEPKLDNEEKKILKKTNIVSIYSVKELFEKHLPKNYRTYKQLKEWFKNDMYRK